MLLEAAIFFLLAAGVKKAWEDFKGARAAYGKRADAAYPDRPRQQRARHALRRDLGYALSQVSHGFPEARQGFSSGWAEGRQAHLQAKEDMARRRAVLAEAEAGHAPRLREYRDRRQAALEEIRRQKENPAAVPGACPECDAPAGTRCSRRHEEGTGEEGNGEAPGFLRAVRRPPAADTRPGTSTAGGNEDPQPEGTSPQPPDGAPEGATAPSPATTEGDNMTVTASDTTYDGIQARMTAAAGAAEQRVAELEQSRATAEEQAAEADASKQYASMTAEQMQGLGVDPESYGAMADHLDAVDAAEKAHQDALEALDRAKTAQQRALETAQNVQGTLARNHGLHQQAHDDSPAVSADAGFYGR